MSAHPSEAPPPALCAKCHCATTVLNAVHCPYTSAGLGVRLRGTACCLPDDRRREIIRELVRSDGRLAWEMQKHILPEARIAAKPFPA